MGQLRSLLSVYSRLMNAHPWKTTLLATGVIACSGDLIAQQVVEQRGFKNHDCGRSLKFFVMGTIFIGPTLRTWYLFLDKLVIGTGSAVALKKMLTDQCIFAPIFIASFFTVSDLIDGKSKKQIKNEFLSKYVPALKCNYVIWPTVQIANFFMVPLQHRVIVANFVALFWNTYLAWAASNCVPSQQ